MLSFIFLFSVKLSCTAAMFVVNSAQYGFIRGVRGKVPLEKKRMRFFRFLIFSLLFIRFLLLFLILLLIFFNKVYVICFSTLPLEFIHRAFGMCKNVSLYYTMLYDLSLLEKINKGHTWWIKNWRWFVFQNVVKLKRATDVFFC